MAIFGMDERLVKMIVIAAMVLSAAHLLGFQDMSALEFVPEIVRDYVLTLLGVVVGIGAWLVFQREL